MSLIIYAARLPIKPYVCTNEMVICPKFRHLEDNLGDAKRETGHMGNQKPRLPGLFVSESGLSHEL